MKRRTSPGCTVMSTFGMSSARAGFFRAPPRGIPDRLARRRRALRRAVAHALAACIALVIGSAAASEPRAAGSIPGIAPEIAQRLSRLDCSRVDAADVRDVLAHVPAPRIVLLQGSVAFV